MNAEAGQKADLYVATDGNDAWTGTLESPNADGRTGRSRRSGGPAMPCAT